MKKLTRGLLVTTAIASAVVLAMMADVQLHYLSRISVMDKLLSIENSPIIDSRPCNWPNPPGEPPCDLPLPRTEKIAVVFGAGLRPDGTPSDALRDRLQIGADLYAQHKASLVVLTGDDGRYHQDEIDSMKTYILAHGVTSTDLVVDGTGYRTYESCKNLKEMGVTHAILITQRFHLARALFLCNQLGIESVGAIADRQSYGQKIYYFWLRDLASSVKAWWDIHVFSPKSPA